MKLKTKQKSLKQIDIYSLEDFVRIYFIRDKDGKLIRCTLARDLTVQRKGVWPKSMKQNYFSDVAVGDCDNNALHYVDLETSRYTAEKTGQLNYAKHLNRFMKNGYIGTHVDGGNRTDSIVDTLMNIIKVEAANYNFGEQEDGNVLYFSLEKDTFFKDLSEDFQNAILQNGSIQVCTYYNLTKNARKDLFKKLNDGLPLIAAELRNSEESDVCEINRNFDLENEKGGKYDSLLVDTKVLTSKGAERWQLAEYVAKVKYAKRNLKEEFDEKKGEVVVEVKWPSSTDIDKDYLVTSDADTLAVAEHNFFEKKFVPYLELLKKDNSALTESNLYTDLWLVLSYMDTKSYDLKYPVNKKKKLAFLKSFNDKFTEFDAEENDDYISKKTKGIDVKVTFGQLYSKNSDLVLTQRLQRWVDEFIKVSPLVNKVTIRKSSTVTRQLKSRKIVGQGFKTTISDTTINTLKVAGGKAYNVDHVEDLRNSGADEEYNMSYEVAKDNFDKGAVKNT